ncbi:C-type lectin domain family 17, member A-like isoform X2 [Dicentrarchus labrax]|uniref:C-type lectin domain family 17, member A-like isoform X2 n=1 Tax=Dicentrarchus labrax TaxID=13489 RepID=UPI0021F67A5D|nr:C-type lectin domain family 17, member A-like isoform X2 [Dicentrarchus labrax]
MEEIYANVEYDKPIDPRPSANQTGPRSSERRFHGSVVFCLGLFTVLLLVGLICLGVHYRDLSAELSTINGNLTELLQASKDKLSSMTEERDLLNASLTEMTKEVDRLQRLSKQKKTCPAGWKMFSCTCYLFSTNSYSWEEGRQDCRERGADLVIIDSSEEQEFLTKNIRKDTWIGLTDRVNEGTWKWTDGTPLTLAIPVCLQPAPPCFLFGHTALPSSIPPSLCHNQLSHLISLSPTTVNIQ